VTNRELYELYVASGGKLSTVVYDGLIHACSSTMCSGCEVYDHCINSSAKPVISVGEYDRHKIEHPEYYI